MDAEQQIADEMDWLTEAQVYDLFRLEGEDRCLETIDGAPHCVLGNGIRRWSRAQLFTWAALGGISKEWSRTARLRELRQRAMNDFHRANRGGGVRGDD